jgi:hypothetical protein
MFVCFFLEGGHIHLKATDDGGACTKTNQQLIHVILIVKQTVSNTEDRSKLVVFECVTGLCIYWIILLATTPRAHCVMRRLVTARRSFFVFSICVDLLLS